jgi:hypothetical protein
MNIEFTTLEFKNDGKVHHLHCDGSFSLIVKENKVIILKDKQIPFNDLKHEPKFKHDCSRCVFMGYIWSYKRNQAVDLYFCPQCGLPTVIVRYGNEGHDYTSGIGLEDEDIKIGVEIAKKLELLK